MTKLWIVLAVCILTFLCGLFLGYKLYNPSTKPFTDKPAIYLHDTSIVLKVVTDTVFKTHLEKVPGTQVTTEGSVTILPGRTDTVVTIETRGDTVYYTRTIGCDTIELQFASLLDNKDGTIRMQFKVNGGTILNGVTVPRKSLNIKQFSNNIGILGTFAPKDGTSNVGVFYNKGIGPFTIGGSVATQIKQYDNIQLGIQAGVRF